MAALKAVADSPPDAKKGKKRRVSGVVFPYYDLKASIEVAKKIHQEGGGECDRSQLAPLLGYNGVKNGSFLTRVTSAKTFGLIAQDGDKLRTTARARAIISPITDADATAAKVAAFLEVELFKKVYEQFKGQTLPNEAGLQNLLEHTHQVVHDRVAPTVKVMRESAQEAGFFRNGNQTQLVLPLVAAQPSPTPTGRIPVDPPVVEQERPLVRRIGGGGGDGGGGFGNIHPAILGLLNELPVAGTALSEKRRNRLIEAFKAVVGYIYPDEDASGSNGGA